VLQLKDYVAAFVRVYRDQVDKLKDNEKVFFGEHVKEQTLSKPCQVEVIEFDAPYHLVWLFLFDRTKPDLMVSIRNGNWKNVGVLITEFEVKYSELQIDLQRLYRTLEHFHNIPTGDLNYSMDVFKSAHLICFPHDIRLGAWPLSRALAGDSSPEAIAKMIFYLNYSQSRDRY